MGRAYVFAWGCLAITACESEVEIRRNAPQEPPAQGGNGAVGGAGGEPIGGEPSVEPAPPGTPPECVAYCEAAAIRGCPKVDDCESSCSLLFGGFCDAEVAAFLECSPSLLNEECIVGYPED